MARTFTTSFTYCGIVYTAVVTELQDMMHIFVPDDSLHEVLPMGRVFFDKRKGFKIDALQLSLEQHLVLNILSAAELYKQRSSKSMSHSENFVESGPMYPATDGAMQHGLRQ